jgi:hypothetical protein
MGEGDQGREHQGELSGSKHSALETRVFTRVFTGGCFNVSRYSLTISSHLRL